MKEMSDFSDDMAISIDSPKANKYDDSKLRYDLIPSESLEELAKVYTIGAEKYGDRNWENGLRFGRTYAACMRHLQAFWMGEDTDFETGLHHLAQAAWNCFAMLAYMKWGRLDLDDRPHKKNGKLYYTSEQHFVSLDDYPTIESVKDVFPVEKKCSCDKKLVDEKDKK